VSIPRDLSGIPFAGGGNSGGMPVNSIYFIRYRDPSLPHPALDRQGLKRFSKDVGAFLGTEVDHWALTRFSTFAHLINALGGLRLDIDEEVLDSSYHHGSSRGVWFPAARDYKLKGDPKCKPKPRKCHSALVYARSRKGTMGGEFNNDWRRAERQQDIVRAGIKQVVEERGAGLALLGTLLRVRDLETDIPRPPRRGTLRPPGKACSRRPTKVLAPVTWAGLTADGRIVPNLPAIRRWADGHLPAYSAEPAIDLPATPVSTAILAPDLSVPEAAVPSEPGPRDGPGIGRRCLSAALEWPGWWLPAACWPLPSLWLAPG
jgi:hypothetical protein